MHQHETDRLISDSARLHHRRHHSHVCISCYQSLHWNTIKFEATGTEWNEVFLGGHPSRYRTLFQLFGDCLCLHHQEVESRDTIRNFRN
jgi:hypothetical protein